LASRTLIAPYQVDKALVFPNAQTQKVHALLKLTSAERDRQRARLAQARDQERQLQDDIADIAAELSRTRDQSRRHAECGTVQLDQLRELDSYARQLRQRQEQSLSEQTRLQDHIEQCRVALADAEREVRVLERLCEKQALADHVAQCRAETRRLDEFAHRKVGVALPADFRDK
jgi:flagellar export protein FliJ